MPPTGPGMPSEPALAAFAGLRSPPAFGNGPMGTIGPVDADASRDPRSSTGAPLLISAPPPCDVPGVGIIPAAAPGCLSRAPA